MQQDLSQRTIAELRAELARQEISYAQLAALLGVETKAVWRRMRGDVPITLDWLAQVAGAIGVDPRRLVVPERVAV